MLHIPIDTYTHLKITHYLAPVSPYCSHTSELSNLPPYFVLYFGLTFFVLTYFIRIQQYKMQKYRFSQIRNTFLPIRLHFYRIVCQICAENFWNFGTFCLIFFFSQSSFTFIYLIQSSPTFKYFNTLPNGHLAFKSSNIFVVY